MVIVATCGMKVNKPTRKKAAKKTSSKKEKKTKKQQKEGVYNPPSFL
jgi:hypothetical protein